ncbi:hypothetical protein SLEP1_g54601 [Rubroshorea leprosula]|uniref:Uncharacterized protein n=1 Tax=Rubroshorea leprosula TaxID=152421 RepID=A0AAV5MD45_9ROSI|nr:hypothetical protein SLEP1_g54601 [Rubroshorea leprosula]
MHLHQSFHMILGTLIASLIRVKTQQLVITMTLLIL